MSKNPLVKGSNGWYLAAGTIIWIAVYAIVMEGLTDIGWYLAMLDSVIMNTLLAVVVFGVMHTLQYYRPNYHTFLVTTIGSGLLTTIWLLIDQWLPFQFIEDPALIQAFEHTMLLRGSYAFLIFCGALTAAQLWYKLKDEEELQSRKEATEQSVREAELLKLRHQLQPHFLFNSLNSINALISSKPEEARTMVHQLSNFLRGTLRQEENKAITLDKEVEFLRLYLEIEKVRFGHRLNTELDLSEASLQCQLPPLLLQPLMENAIKFGLYGTTGDVNIGMHSSISGNYLVVSISNPIDDEVEASSGTGFGLRSIQRRLFLIFGRNDLMQTQKTTETFTVTLKIPQSNA